jgi:hypothetical protein
MPLTITQGPLPSDNTQVDPSTFVATWINNTTVVGLPSGAFAGGTLQFVYSQTNAPASAERFVGMLWFQRGNGRLWKWDKPDLPSGLTYSDANWIQMNDARMLWGRAINPVPAGAPVSFPTGASSASYPSRTTPLTYSGAYGANIAPGEDNFARPIWGMFSFSASSGGTECWDEVTFLAYETAATDGLFRMIEAGFATALLPSGETGRSGVCVIDEFRPWGYRMVEATCGSRCQFMPVAEAVDSSATAPGTAWLRTVFKHIGPFIGTSATV